MRFAYQITVHDKAYQFRWLFDAIYNPHDLFAIHVDTKATASTKKEIWQIVGEKPNVSLVSTYSVIYSEWALCQIELDAIRFLLDHHHSWDLYINLSGQDYPLKNRDAIEQDLSNHYESNFINIKHLEECPAYFRRRLQWFCFRLGDHLIRTPLRRPPSRHFDISWHGSAWHILSRDFCEWLIKDEKAKAISQFLKNVKMPNEFLMQALIMHSPFKDTLVPDYRRKVIWRQRQPHPEVLRIQDLDEVLSSECLFARKFDEQIDRSLLEAIARYANLVRPDSHLRSSQPEKEAHSLGRPEYQY